MPASLVLGFVITVTPGLAEPHSPPLRGGEFSLSLPIGHLMHDLTAGHGHVGGDVADRRFRYSERIGAQNREVSELPRFERTLLVLIEGQIGAVQSRAAQRPRTSDRLLGRDTFIGHA